MLKKGGEIIVTKCDVVKAKCIAVLDTNLRRRRRWLQDCGEN